MIGTFVSILANQGTSRITLACIPSAFWVTSTKHGISMEIKITIRRFTFGIFDWWYSYPLQIICCRFTYIILGITHITPIKREFSPIADSSRALVRGAIWRSKVDKKMANIREITFHKKKVQFDETMYCLHQCFF